MADGWRTVSGHCQFEVRQTSTSRAVGGRFPDVVYEVTRFVSCRRCSCEFTAEIIIAKFGMDVLLKWSDILKWNDVLKWKHTLPNLAIIISAVNSQLQRLQLTNRVTSYTTSGKRPPTTREVDVFRTSNWQGPETVRKSSTFRPPSGPCFRPTSEEQLGAGGAYHSSAPTQHSAIDSDIRRDTPVVQFCDDRHSHAESSLQGMR